MKLTLKRGIAFLLVVVITSNTYIPVYAQEEQEVQEIDLAKEKTAGLQKVDGKYYYFGEDGTALTGWIEIDGNMYYFAPDSGQAYTNTTEVINDVEYVFSSEGIATEKTSDEILTDENWVRKTKRNLPRMIRHQAQMRHSHKTRIVHQLQSRKM